MWLHSQHLIFCIHVGAAAPAEVSTVVHCVAGKATTFVHEEVANADTSDHANTQEGTTAGEEAAVGPSGSPHPTAQLGNMENKHTSSHPFQLCYLHTCSCIAKSAHVCACVHTTHCRPFLVYVQSIVLHLLRWHNLTCPKQPLPVI